MEKNVAAGRCQIGRFFVENSPPFSPSNHTHFHKENTFSPSLPLFLCLCRWVWVMGAFPVLSQIQETAYTMAHVSLWLCSYWLYVFSTPYNMLTSKDTQPVFLTDFLCKVLSFPSLPALIGVLKRAASVKNRVWKKRWCQYLVLT